MCGPVNSILGRAVDPILNRFISNLPSSFPVASGEVRLRGAVVQIDERSGRALSITRVDEPVPHATVGSELEPKPNIENSLSSEQT
jgi:calcineurin-like phosphoesterase